MKFILFLLSICYLIIEFSFNVILVDLLSDDSIHSFGNIDIIGRCISAIGLTIIAFRAIILIIKKPIIKFLLSIVILPSVAYGTYVAQEKVVDYLTKITPMEEKKEQIYTYIFKRGISNGAINYDLIENFKGLSQKEKDVLTVSSVYWGLGYPDFISYTKTLSETQIRKEAYDMYSIDFKTNTDYYSRSYDDLYFEVKKIYKSYRASYNRIANHHEIADNQIHKAWIKKLEVEKSLINRYASIAQNIRKREEKALRSGFYRKSFPYELKTRFKRLSNCSSISCLEAMEKVLSRETRLKGMDYRIDSNCKMTPTGSKNKIYFKTRNGTETHTNKNYFPNFSKYKGITCIVDMRKAENYALDKMYAQIKKDYGITDFSARTKSEFARSQASSDAINNLVYAHSGVKLPKGWNRSDKEGFYSAFRNHSLGDLYKLQKEKMIQDYGFYLRKGLTEEQFLKNKAVKNSLKDNLLIFDYNGIMKSKDIYLNKEKFHNYYHKIVPKNMANFYLERSENDDVFVDATFKMTIIPIVAICFSLFFGLLNFAIIIKDVAKVTGLLKKKYVSIIFTIVITSSLLVTPLLLTNNLTDSNKYKTEIYPSMKKFSKIGELGYRWVVNGEIFLFSSIKESYLDRIKELVLIPSYSLKEDLEDMGQD